MIVHTIVVVGTIIRKVRIGDTIPATTQNVKDVKKDAAQTPIVAVLTVVPATVAGGEKENVLCLNHQWTIMKNIKAQLAVKDR